MSKKYYNITQVANMLEIEVHKIRYWDSIDPKTKKLRIDGLSTKSKGGTRYFNKENIDKLRKLKKLLYDGKIHNYSINLANKILLSNNNIQNIDNKVDYNNIYENSKNLEKIKQILENMKKLLKNNNNLH